MEGKPAFETCYFLPKTVRVATESKVKVKKQKKPKKTLKKHKPNQTKTIRKSPKIKM